jgi:glycosyltransferase involved in cell wall biosynthesis
VSTRVGGVAEVVADSETGLLASSGDPEALAVHICCLAGDPGRRDRMGRAGRQRAEELFSERRMHDAYGHIYEELAGKRGRNRRDRSAFKVGRDQECR